MQQSKKVSRTPAKPSSLPLSPSFTATKNPTLPSRCTIGAWTPHCSEYESPVSEFQLVPASGYISGVYIVRTAAIRLRLRDL